MAVEMETVAVAATYIAPKIPVRLGQSKYSKRCSHERYTSLRTLAFGHR
ncbi:MAG: hypothetical protein CLLPBCKN_007492 [Chroococcidiopsis cubana SAG 39.79]|nr:hypothetical protein [Chroococcidiopsis cubana SAG 39.79]